MKQKQLKYKNEAANAERNAQYQADLDAYNKINKNGIHIIPKS